ncbi:MAG: sensor histidine kinase, partial [Myxococcota bacterium]
LLKETHHRVKNNLQVISSLLSMQAERSPTETVKQELRDTMSRVRAMGLVHQMLYGGYDLVHVDLHGYLEAIVWELRAIFDRDADIHVDAAPAAFTLEQAVPFGLIVNELLTNACKHGRSEDGRARVRLSLHADEFGVLLEVSDGGPGFPSGRAPLDGSGSLGMTLLTALSRQLDATLVCHPGPGAKITLRIPPRVERPRHAPTR